MNLSKSFNRPFLYGCAVFSVLYGHTQAAEAASTSLIPDDATAGTTAAPGKKNRREHQN